MPADKSRLNRVELAQYYVSNLFVRALIWVMRLLPYERRIPAMGRLVRLVAPLAGYHKRVRDNLAITCPDLPEAEITRLCNEVPDTAGRAIMEHFSHEEFIPRASESLVTGPGVEAFDDAIAAGKPVMMITGHFGNYMAARVALQKRGKPIGSLYRRMANPYFNDIYVEAFLKTGEPMFQQGRRGMMEMVRWLKNGGVISIVSDLHAVRGEPLTFFGKPAATSLLNAELALKYDAVMIPCYAIRQPDGLSFEVLLNAPVPHSDPATMTQYINDDLEKVVRRHMGQWFWVHRRWKHWTGLQGAS